jgi:lysozyme family protein
MASNAQPQGDPKRSSKSAVVGGSLAVAVAAILGALYANEGGYVNHPDDPGGATKYGVTEAVARKADYRGDMRDFPKHCSAEAPVCADSIYIRQYFEGPGIMPLVSIEPAVADELVNTAANMGAPRPSRWFQQSLNEMGVPVIVDGKIGPASIAAYRVLQQTDGKVAACVQMLDKLDARQRAEYDRLVRVNPRLRKFYRGWVNNRIGNVNRSDCGRGWE